MAYRSLEVLAGSTPATIRRPLNSHHPSSAIARDGGLDGVEEADELLMAMPLSAVKCQLAVFGWRFRKQRGILATKIAR
jgi:hypothetical protein